MVGRKRNRKQRERDLVTVASYYCQGLYQYQITEKMGLSQSQICYDLKAIRKRWMESSVPGRNEGTRFLSEGSGGKQEGGFRLHKRSP